MTKQEEKLEKLYEDSETGCCKKFNPEPWQEKEIIWHDRLFLKDHVASFLHIPLNFGKVMMKNMEKIKKANALLPNPLMLSDENSLFGSDLYIAVSKDVPDSEMAKISGTFLTKVYDGSYKNMGKWTENMKKYIDSKDKKLKKMYYFYTTCPNCAKHYDEQYTVLLAKVD